MLFSQLQVNILNNRCGNYHFKVRQQQQKHHIALNVSQEIVFFARSMKGLGESFVSAVQKAFKLDQPTTPKT